MRYKIEGGSLPVVTIELNRGESIFTQSGGMSWMSGGIDMDTNMKGGFLGGLGRMFTGESLFLATYTSRGEGQQIALASSFPGSIIALEIGPGREFICQKSSFLCATPGVNLSVEWMRRVGAGLFGGDEEALEHILQHEGKREASDDAAIEDTVINHGGQGLAFLEIDGHVVEKTLAPGEQLKVNTGNVAAFESSVRYNIETVKGFKNVLFGGEGLFLTVLTGPGRVWLQTISMPEFAQKIIPFLPTPSSGN